MPECRCKFVNVNIFGEFINISILADNTKYHNVVWNIETEILFQVSDFVSLPTKNAYGSFKSALLIHLVIMKNVN